MYFSIKMFVVFSFISTCLLLHSATAMSCFKCYSEEECKTPDYVECDVEQVKETSKMFSFLPRSQTQVESPAFNCASYNAVLSNTSVVQLSGCFYSTYNPCEDIHTIPAQKWTCKYCDTKDGCNPATKVLENVFLIGIVTMFIIYIENLY